jgi:hypothetical protein
MKTGEKAIINQMNHDDLSPDQVKKLEDCISALSHAFAEMNDSVKRATVVIQHFCAELRNSGNQTHV